MTDLVIYLTLAISLLILVLLGIILFNGNKRRNENEVKQDEPVRARVTLPPRNPDDGPRRRQRQNRVPLAAQRNQQEDVDDEDDELSEMIELPDGKIGVKKRRKLEMKAEKRASRERELQEREERKERQAKLEEMRKKEEEKIKKEEQLKEEEERKIREEKERQEHEEYLKLKESFQIEEEGFDDDVNDENESQNKLKEFIDYINKQKVVLMEDLAGHFQMKTQDVISRVQDLLAQQLLVGVIDDRGKFISITKAELESVAKFIQRRGRVSLNELVENSNKLINLNQDS